MGFWVFCIVFTLHETTTKQQKHKCQTRPTFLGRGWALRGRPIVGASPGNGLVFGVAPRDEEDNEEDAGQRHAHRDALNVSLLLVVFQLLPVSRHGCNGSEDPLSLT